MAWTNSDLAALAEHHPHWVVESTGDCLTLSNDEGIDAFIYAGDRQIVVETILFPADSVSDTAALNELILRTHQLIPLSTVGLSHLNGQDYYVAFGSLSVDSKETVVIEEIESLFANVTDFLDLYADHLKEEGLV